MAKKTAKKTAKKAAKKVTKKVAKKVTKKTAKKVTKKAPPKVKLKAPSVNLKKGDKAPDFKLIDQNGESVRLSDFKGKNVVVYFYPRAMTPGCTVQACGLRDAENELQKMGIIVLGISPDPVKKLKQFEDKQHLNFRLLSDEDHQVAEAYGSWGPKKFMGREFMGILRQTFLIGKDGKLLDVWNKVNTKTHHQDVLNFFKGL